MTVPRCTESSVSPDGQSVETGDANGSVTTNPKDLSPGQEASENSDR